MEKVRTILNNIAKCTISAISENTILDPVSRAEHYLHCIATGGTEVLEPITRVEHYLYCIATGDISILEPIGEPVGRFEQYLKAIIDNNFEELPEPITRREHILYSAITGNTDDIPFEDIGSGGRFEEFLYQLALNGGIEYIISLGNDPTNIPLPNSVNGRAEVVEMGGNTLVNCIDMADTWFTSETVLKTDSKVAVGLSSYAQRLDISRLRSNTVYTAIACIDYSVVKKGEIYVQLNTEINGVQNSIFRIYENNFNKPFLITTGNFTNLKSRNLFIGGINCEYKVRHTSVIMLEGDYTNKPIPKEFFEGMKSTGETKDNSVDITVKNPNIIDDVYKDLIFSTGTVVEKINNYSFKAVVDGSKSWQQVIFRHPLLYNAKANNKFTIFIESATLLNQCNEDISFGVTNIAKNIFLHHTVVYLNKNKPLKNILIHCTVPSDYNETDRLEFRMHINLSTPFANELTVNNIVLAEGHVDIKEFTKKMSDKTTVNLPHPLRGLPNGVSDKLVYLEGKNLFNGKEARGQFMESTGIFSPNSGTYNQYGTVDYIKCKPNKAYVFNKFNGGRTFFYDINKKYIGNNVNNGTYFTTPNDCYYLHFHFNGTLEGVMLEEGYKPTDYEPFAPEGKGLYLEKNVDQYIISGNEGWKMRDPQFGGYIKIDCDNVPNLITPTDFSNCHLFAICDKLPVFNGDDRGAEYIMTRVTGRGFIISLSETKASDLNGVINFVKGVKIQYQTKKPTYTKVSDINLKCFKDATVFVNSGAIDPSKTVIEYPIKKEISVYR